MSPQEPNCHTYAMPSEPTIIRSGSWTSLRSEERNRSPPQTRRPLNLLVRCEEGLSEQLSRTYQSHGVNLFHKPSNIIRYHLLVHPKDKTPKEKLCGTIYHITCDDDAHHIYIGETMRPLGVLFKEYCKLDKPTGVGDHYNATGHSVSIDNLKVLDREQDWMKRKVKEEIHIKHLL